MRLNLLSIVAFNLAAAVFVLGGPAIAGDGEYFDIAVADSLVRTKKIHRSHVYGGGGYGFLGGVDDRLGVAPANQALLLKAGYYGISIDRHARLLSVALQTNMGLHTADDLRLDAGKIKLSIYHRIEGARLAFATCLLTRNKTIDERRGAGFNAMEYSAGGRMGAFLFTLSSRFLGYRFKQRFSTTDYHGLFVAGLRLGMGVIIARDRRLSLELSSFGDISLTVPKMREIDAGVRAILHLNNAVLPVVVSIDAGYAYFNEDSDAIRISYDHVTLSSMVGLRF